MSSSLTESLLGMLGGQVMEQLGGQIGADPATTQKAVGAALPLLLGVLGKNAAKPEGAAAILGALKRDHDGSVLKDVGGFIARGGNKQDGEGILKHALGGQRTVVQQGISQATGLSGDAAGSLLAMLAPLVMGGLGQAQRQGGLDVGSLAKLLSGERQAAQGQLSQLSGMARFLDLDGDGSLQGEAMSFGAKLLKWLFGRK